MTFAALRKLSRVESPPDAEQLVGVVAGSWIRKGTGKRTGKGTEGDKAPLGPA